jgi:predicted GTPase
MSAREFDSLEKPLIVLVVGECGDGKSSLIRHFYESTPKDTQRKIMHHFNSNLELPDPPGVGASTSGVTKQATAYPVVIGTRSVILIDTPGVGDSDIKPEQILAGLMKELESDVLNVVLLCLAMPKKRLTMGQKFCTRLIDKAIDEECKWENFILVGTQKDLYYPKKTKEKQGAKWECWRTDMLATMSESCDGEVTKSALVCISAVDSDSDSEDDSDHRKQMSVSLLRCCGSFSCSQHSHAEQFPMRSLLLL